MADLTDLSRCEHRPRPADLLILLSSQTQRRCLAPYGGMVPAPSFERIASRGVVFDQFYCSDASPGPARASLVSGRLPHAHGVTSQDAGFGPKEYSIARPGERWLVDRLLDAGYAHCHDGIGDIARDPADDRRREYAHFASDDFPYGRAAGVLIAQGGSGQEQYGPAVTVHTDTGPVRILVSIPHPIRWPDAVGAHPDSRRARRVADFILGTPPDIPLSIYFVTGAPHPPMLVPDEYLQMFDPEHVPRPHAFSEDTWHMPDAIATNPHHQSVLDWDARRWARVTAAYYGYVAFADACCGVVLDAMQTAGRLDDAVILMSTTCGEMLGSHHAAQTGLPYQDCLHLPCVLSAPGLTPGRCGHLCSSIDIAPTLLELLDLPPLTEAHGTSMLPALTTPGYHGRGHVVSEFGGYIRGGWKWRAIITNAHKYIYYHEDRVDQLFDLRADPDEIENLVHHPKYFDARKQLRELLAAEMAKTGDPIKPRFPE